MTFRLAFVRGCILFQLAALYTSASCSFESEPRVGSQNAGAPDWVPPATAGGRAGSAGFAGSAGAAGGGAEGSVETPAHSEDSARLSCARAEPLAPEVAGANMIFMYSGSTSSARNRTQSYVGCASAASGPEQFHKLDLSHLRGRFRLHAIVDAAFEPVLSLWRGECEDLDPQFCTTDSTGLRAARFSGEFEPDRYLISVDGVSASDHGAYHLQVIAEPLDAECTPPNNTDCSSALELTDTTGITRFFVPAPCNPSEGPVSRFYRIDLSAEAAPVGFHASAESTSQRLISRTSSRDYSTFSVWPLDASGGCLNQTPIQPWVTGEDLAVGTVLQPGAYAVEIRGQQTQPSYARLAFHRPDCSGNNHDTCDEAEDIVLVGDQAVIQADTYCNSNKLSAQECALSGPAPDRFYRLDLSARPDRTRVRANISPRGLSFDAILVLMREAGGDCGQVIQCRDMPGDGDGWPRFDMILEPAVYLIAVEGASGGAAGQFTLRVDVSDWRSKRFVSCYGGDVDDCLMSRNDAGSNCCENPLASGCGTLFISCGLDPQVQDCVCESDPVCCNGSPDDFERCAPVFEACGYFCTDVHTSFLGCLEYEDLTDLIGPP